jgi:hypothetical protein
MAFSEDEIVAQRKREIVEQMFIETADDNYIVARQCYTHQLMADFLWLSVHCLEKYMKAVLLLNGKPSHKNPRGKGYGHDLTKLYPEVKSLAGTLLPERLMIHPNLVGTSPWRDETPDDFLATLYQDGQADNRYALLSRWNFPDVLFKVDMMVFYIRRLCRQLSAKGPNDQTKNRQRLKEDTSLWRLEHEGKLGRVVDGNGQSGLQHILLNLNPWFAPPSYGHDWTLLHFSGRDGLLDWMVLRPSGGDPDDPATKAAHMLYDWVLNNIFMSDEIKKEFKETREEAIAEAVRKYGPRADPAQRRP